MFAACCFVPVLRSEDNTSQPVVGEPWSPDPRTSKCQLPLVDAQSPTKSPLNVKALAGPMSTQKVRLCGQNIAGPQLSGSMTGCVVQPMMGPS